jgi:hypothetical protein
MTLFKVSDAGHDNLAGILRRARMGRFWNRDFLTRRIDRCYLIAAGTRNSEKRKIHLELARHYRKMLASLKVHAGAQQQAVPVE